MKKQKEEEAINMCVHVFMSVVGVYVFACACVF